MSRSLLPSALFVAALSWAAFADREAEAQEVDEPVEVAAGCAATAEVACKCPNGSWSRQTCTAGGFFTACACASASLDIPGFSVPNIDFNRPKKPKRRSSGVGMLIGGLITLGLGTVSLAIGVTLIREDTVLPLGVVLTATGGTAMLVGLPLSIVGIVNVARNDDRGYYSGSLEPPAVQWSFGPGGLRLAF